MLILTVSTGKTAALSKEKRYLLEYGNNPPPPPRKGYLSVSFRRNDSKRGTQKADR
jgi:hypothetical protein